MKSNYKCYYRDNSTVKVPATTTNLFNILVPSTHDYDQFVEHNYIVPATTINLLNIVPATTINVLNI